MTPQCRKEEYQGYLDASSINRIIKEVRSNRGELAVIWLDLTNAYGIIPHKLVELTLERYHHIPRKIRTMLSDYYEKFKMRFSVTNYTTSRKILK